MRSTSHLRYNPTDFPIGSSYMLVQGQPSPCAHTFLRPSIPQTNLSGTEILICFPFAYANRLGLGPGLPREDKLYSGNLGLPASGILTRFLATHSCILTSDTSSTPYGIPSTAYRTLSYQCTMYIPQLRFIS